MTKTREVNAGIDCPKCGKPIMSTEHAMMSAQQELPVKWVVDARYCSGGCYLTAADVEEA